MRINVSFLNASKETKVRLKLLESYPATNQTNISNCKTISEFVSKRFSFWTLFIRIISNKALVQQTKIKKKMQFKHKSISICLWNQQFVTENGITMTTENNIAIV